MTKKKILDKKKFLAIMESMGLSRAVMSREAGFASGYLTNALSRQSPIAISTLQFFATMLDCSVEDIIIKEELKEVTHVESNVGSDDITIQSVYSELHDISEKLDFYNELFIEFITVFKEFSTFYRDSWKNED